ncbi:MAG: hypothetical protein HYW15_00030 [Candidatus Giovannonibacteria bacterium]|nr:MAG: hypothetical protein HYW15_00030 [Candidatus Giovannonibacteria bacterium]
MNHNQHDLVQDLAIMALSVLIAVILATTDILAKILASAQELKLLGSFIAGMFFTSVFTVAPAVVALGKIAQANSALQVAIFGAAGAVVGDLIIFRFVRDRLSGHLAELMRNRGVWKRISALFKLKSFRWVAFFVGGLIIASPLPDEAGVSLMGLSKIKTSWFIPLSFAFNFAGILLIAAAAKAL